MLHTESARCLQYDDSVVGPLRLFAVLPSGQSTVSYYILIWFWTQAANPAVFQCLIQLRRTDCQVLVLRMPWWLLSIGCGMHVFLILAPKFTYRFHCFGFHLRTHSYRLLLLNCLKSLESSILMSDPSCSSYFESFIPNYYLIFYIIFYDLHYFWGIR